ncbi:IucA/IucC family C-terminal-domain containing protein [Kosakonia oryzendophytica]|uniref:IucA/IucC family C-terminal-domain containing protein n=1 Tax=Kosakonia oryzendophytica TaxID=1005665 RepID=UPI003D33F1D0
MLSPEEYSYLQNTFRLRSLAQADERSVPASAMLDDDTCRAVLQRVMTFMGAPDLAIAASLLAKRLAFLASGNVLYAMTVFDKGLPLSLTASRLEYAHDNGVWRSSLPVDVTTTQAASGERETWRAEIVSTLFKGYFAPLWQSLARVSGLPEAILWENTAVRVYSLYQGRMETLDAVQEQRRQADFHWLLEQAEPEQFGLAWNPLKRFRRPLQNNAAGQAVRFRRTCCFYYKASQPVEYCHNCPLLKKS